MMQIISATTPSQIELCYAVMRDLRPHLELDEFLTQVQRQQRDGGYRLIFAEHEVEIRAAAGYRVSENLAWGRFLYVDDLVVRATDHGSGYGSALFDWLVSEAQREQCDELHLDSGVQRFIAHRFYLHKGMDITSHHFALRL
ncbi:MAG TPA: GNAT family N-acetyltransferase [Chthoniobacteraceae bacterium]|nr:GNAT family N-acetyltransferase [Chthoniobacteraceae bacterium]